MNLSMFIKLHIGVKKGEVKMTSDYKHFDYMFDKKWITPTVVDFDDHSTKNVFMMLPQYGDTVEITREGEEKYYSVRNSWLKWVITSIIAILGLCSAVIGTLVKLLS
ncbi:hypothetical protein [Staphylococcus borealis]|uniref:hypothetical protein n=1 Tax=Staphylococcus borealis TaxID=2742203 RepID=UPI00374F6CFD